MQVRILTFFIFCSSVLIGQIVVNEETHYCELSNLDNYEQTISISRVDAGVFGSPTEEVVREIGALLDLLRCTFTSV